MHCDDELGDIHVFTLHSFLISFSNGSIVAGPLLQFSPTTAAPASSRRRHASGKGISSNVVSGTKAVNVITAGKPEYKQTEVDAHANIKMFVWLFTIDPPVLSVLRFIVIYCYQRTHWNLIQNPCLTDAKPTIVERIKFRGNNSHMSFPPYLPERPTLTGETLLPLKANSFF